MCEKKFEVKTVVSDETVVDVLTTALEGGSNYWYYMPDLTMVREKKSGEYTSEVIIRSVLEDETVKVPVYDLENEKEILGYLSRENIQKGLDLYVSERGVFTDDLDGEESDIFFQYVVIGEITFG